MHGQLYTVLQWDSSASDTKLWDAPGIWGALQETLYRKVVFMWRPGIKISRIWSDDFGKSTLPWSKEKSLRISRFLAKKSSLFRKNVRKRELFHMLGSFIPDIFVFLSEPESSGANRGRKGGAAEWVRSDFWKKSEQAICSLLRRGAPEGTRTHTHCCTRT